MGLVTAFCRSTTTEPGETLVQNTGETRLVVDCKVNVVALVGQVRITLAPEGMIVSWGALTGPNERLNTVPLPAVAPPYAVPYRVWLEKIGPATGLAPSLRPVKLYRVVKPVPLV